MSEHDLFLVHLVATAYMVGVIWFVQIVHYPLMLEVGDAAFCRYSRLHQSRTSYVVGPPMLIEALSGLALIAWSPIQSTEITCTGCAEATPRTDAPFFTSSSLAAIARLPPVLHS